MRFSLCVRLGLHELQVYPSTKLEVLSTNFRNATLENGLDLPSITNLFPMSVHRPVVGAEKLGLS